MNEQEVKVIQTDANAKDGQNKCPKCGSTDISTDTRKGRLRCNFCRHEFEPEKLEGMVTNLENLEGEVLASGAQDIVASANDVVTFKCSSCGAERKEGAVGGKPRLCYGDRHDLHGGKRRGPSRESADSEGVPRRVKSAYRDSPSAVPVYFCPGRHGKISPGRTHAGIAHTRKRWCFQPVDIGTRKR